MSSRSTGPATGSRTAWPPSRPPSRALPPELPARSPGEGRPAKHGKDLPVTTSPGPHSDDDTLDLIDDALATLAERRGAWLGDDLTAITLIASLIHQAARCLPELVHNARANGHSWHQIAQALATSPDQARFRFDPGSPIADSRWPYDWLARPSSQLHNRAAARLCTPTRTWLCTSARTPTPRPDARPPQLRRTTMGVFGIRPRSMRRSRCHRS